MKKLHQKVFRAIVWLLIVIIIGALAVSALLIWQNKNNDASPVSSSSVSEKIETDTYSFTSTGVQIDTSIEGSPGSDYYNIGTSGRIIVTVSTLNDYVNTKKYLSSESDKDASSKINNALLQGNILAKVCSDSSKTITVPGATGTVNMLSGTAQYDGCYIITAITKNRVAVTLYVNYDNNMADVSAIAKRVRESFSVR